MLIYRTKELSHVEMPTIRFSEDSEVLFDDVRRENFKDKGNDYIRFCSNPEEDASVYIRFS